MADTDIGNDVDPRYATYEKWVDRLITVYFENLKSLDNKIVFVSAGTLGLSLNFVSDLVDVESAKFVWLLIISWILLAFAISVNLFGFRFVTTREYFLESIRDLQLMTGLHPGGESEPDFEGAKFGEQARAKKVERFNFASFWLLVLGLGAMLFFVSFNVVFQLSPSSTVTGH